MHSFAELIERSTLFTLSSLEQIEQSALKELETSGDTTSIRNLQMIRLQKAILAVGIFSIFEAHLQQSLSCKDGFKKAKDILLSNDEIDIEYRFQEYLLSINVLKHGRGKSYDKLLARKDILPFKLKCNGNDFFEEGDASEIMTLINVDNDYLSGCVTIIREVNDVILK